MEVVLVFLVLAQQVSWLPLSVWCLLLYPDDKRLFTCSGIVIESTNGCAVILTSASLVATTNGESARAVSENVKVVW